jgi:hypothetical protein
VGEPDFDADDDTPAYQPWDIQALNALASLAATLDNHRLPRDAEAVLIGAMTATADALKAHYRAANSGRAH